MKTSHRILALALMLGALAGAAFAAAPSRSVAAEPQQRAATAKASERAAKPAAESGERHDTPKAEPAVDGAAAHSGEAAHQGEGEEHKAGLPQLNPAYFPGQIFWALVNFSILYLLMANIALPGVKATQEARRRTVKRDLSEARAASEAAQAAQALSEKVLGEARGKAMAAVATIKEGASEESAERQSALQRELIKRVRASEMKISRARVEALQEVQDKAAGIIASEIIGKVAGIAIDPSRLTLPASESGQGRA